jgi:hypothetical protein
MDRQAARGFEPCAQKKKADMESKGNGALDW